MLQQDARVLGCQLVSEEERVQSLIQKAGTVQLQHAMQQVQAQQRSTTQTIQHVAALQQRVVQAASEAARLTRAEQEFLTQNSRTAVYTTFGRHFENDALDEWARQTQTEIRARNEAIMEWPFRQCDNGNHTAEEEKATVIPLGPARALPIRQSRRRKRTKRVEMTDSSTTPTSNHADSKCRPIDATKTDNTKSPVEVIDLASSDNDDDEISSTAEDAVADVTINTEPKPFFSIVGSIDGMRDEIISLGGDDDASWQMETYVVEVKHRMKRISPVPPLYEQVQAVTYALMYQVRATELVQVLRTRTPPLKDRRHTEGEAKLAQTDKREGKHKKPNEEHPTQTLDTWLGIQKTSDDSNEDSKQTKMEDVEKALRPNTLSFTMSVHKVLVDDPVMKHEQSWKAIVLPRLRSMVDAVYRIRSDDNKRYRLLLAVSTDLTSNSKSSASLEAWEMLHAECPWLKNCDTAFRRVKSEAETDMKRDNDKGSR